MQGSVHSLLVLLACGAGVASGRAWWPVPANASGTAPGAGHELRFNSTDRYEEE